MSTAVSEKPRARREGLTIQTIGSEVLVFDHTHDTAHALNRPAAFVWHHADGIRTVDEIALEMAREFGVDADVPAVWYALDQLKRRNLLETQAGLPATWQGMSRRQFLQRAAAGAVLMAVITSIATPTPAHAQSACLGQGVSCVGTTTLCCPGLGCCVGAGPTCEEHCV